MFDITKVNWKKVGIFASGVLFGTAGIKALSSKDAKNVYTTKKELLKWKNFLMQIQQQRLKKLKIQSSTK